VQQARETEVLQGLLWVTRLEVFIGAGVANADHGAAEDVHETLTLVLAASAFVTGHIKYGSVGPKGVADTAALSEMRFH
jgi:hypothetical protein